MARTSLARAVCLMLLAVCAALLAGAAPAGAEVTAEQLRPLLWDQKQMEEALSEIRYFRDADFIYQPELTFAAQAAPTGRESRDWKAVASGFVAADRAYAFFFGSAKDVQAEQKFLASLLPEGTTAELTLAKIASVQKDLDTKEGRARLARMTREIIEKLLARVSQNKEDMRFLGGHIFGAYVEGLYMTSIMALAAAEEGVIAPLSNVRTGTGERMSDELELLSRENLLGSADKSPERAKVVDSLQKLVSANGYRPPLANLRKVVDICQGVRDEFSSPAD